MHPMLRKLEGGDRRSLGRAPEVVAEVMDDPDLFKVLLSGLLSEDALMRMRAADAMQALADLASRNPPLRPSVMLHLQELTAIGTPAMKARGRMLLAAMAGKPRRRSRSSSA